MHRNALPHMVGRKTQLRELFSEKDNNSIELFKRKAEALIDARAKYEDIPSYMYEIKDQDTWSNFKANIPDDDKLIQLLTRFRFFYLTKEPTQFEKIFNIVRNNVVDTWAQNYLD